MSASKELKDAGLAGGVAQAADLCGKHPDTIQNWYKRENELFQIIKRGCVELMRERKLIAEAMAKRDKQK